MSHYSRVHFSDSVLLRRAASGAAHDHSHTAELLADLAEIDARKLYLPAACSSMLCSSAIFTTPRTRPSERIRVARVAREFPAIFESVADGRLSLTAVVQIAPHLTAGTAGDVIAAAAHRSKTEIQRLIAERFPPGRMFRRIWSVSPHQPSTTNWFRNQLPLYFATSYARQAGQDRATCTRATCAAAHDRR